MTASHTPGPWTIAHGHSDRVLLINDGKGGAIGEAVYIDTRRPADARLIAAAPDLLAALQLATHCLASHTERHGVGMDGKALADARAAIERATGGN